MAARFKEKIDDWVSEILASPRNIATEIELREQSRVALNLFIEADIDGSESLSFEELKALCDMAGLPMEDSEEEALVKMDTDDSGTLDIEEWVLWWLKRISALPNPVKQQEAIARNTFKKFDADGSGCLDASELGRLTTTLGAEFTEEELAEALAEVDSDGSGVIEIDEFVAWWTDRASANRSNTSLISLKMRKLAKKAAQVFATDIFSAVWAGDVDLVNAFLVGEPRLVLAADTSEYGDGWTALHYAAYQGNEELVSVLLEHKAEVNRTNDMGFTALFYAAQRGHVGICRTLLEAGADPTIAGICELPQPLGSDGPPGAEVQDPAALQVFMCPVEHCVDTPALRDLFQEMSPKCALPAVPDYDTITVGLALVPGTLSLRLTQPQKAISHLPVKSWELKIRLDMQMHTDLVSAESYADIVASGLTISVSVPALPPKEAQTFTAIPLERGFVKKVQFLCILHKLRRLQLLEATSEALRGAWAEVCTIYSAIDAQYRPVLNLVDLVYLLIKKCPDKQNTKDLRHSLRASVEQVTIRSTVAAAGGSASPGKAARKPQSGVPDPQVVDVKDPVALVTAAITELFTRRAAAQAAAAALAEQLKEEQSKKESADPATALDGTTGSAELRVIPNKPAAKEKNEKGSAAPRPSTGKAMRPAQGTAAPATAAAQEAGGPAAASKGWAWAEDDKTGFPTLAVQVAAVNSWGIGDYSSAVFATISGGQQQRSKPRE